MRPDVADDFLFELAKGQASGELQPGDPVVAARSQLVIEKKGRIRQAGASTDVHDFVVKFRQLCESSLYSFGKGVLKLTLLTARLHKPIADDFLGKRVPIRKLLLLPRDHLKTSVTGRALPIHIQVQPRENNVYYPGCQDSMCIYLRKDTNLVCTDTDHFFPGTNTRILLGYETATNAEAQLRWIAHQFEKNKLLRALWPHCCWEDPKAQAPVWNQQRIVLPRDREEAQPSIDTCGVGAATTGRHYDAHIFDDLFTLEAANSAEVAYKTIEWFKASRAMLDDLDRSLEWTIGTRWAPADLYEYIQSQDPTVQVMIRAAIEDGKPIFPEKFTLEHLSTLEKSLGPLFYLLYMNSAVNAALSSFDMSMGRDFTFDGAMYVFDEDERDLRLANLTGGLPSSPPSMKGVPVQEAAERLSMFHGKDYYMSLKYGRVRATG